MTACKSNLLLRLFGIDGHKWDRLNSINRRCIKCNERQKLIDSTIFCDTWEIQNTHK
jgi:hypothetical protein